jgi:hypothetical protein
MLYGGYFWAPYTRSHGITPVRESWLPGAGESFLDGGGNEAVMQARTSTNSYTRDFHVNKRFPERPSLVTCCGASPHNKTLGLLKGGSFGRCREQSTCTGEQMPGYKQLLTICVLASVL